MQTDCASTEGEASCVFRSNTSRLKFLVVADVASLRQDGNRKHSDGASLSSDWVGRAVVGAVGWGEDRRAGPAGAGPLGTIAEARERSDALKVELARVGGQLGEAA